MRTSISKGLKFIFILFALSYCGFFFSCENSNKDTFEIAIGKHGRLLYHQDLGIYDVFFGDSLILKSSTGAFKLDKKVIRLTDYARSNLSYRKLSDSLGNGMEYTLNFTDPNLPGVEQRFRTLEDQSFFITQITLTGKNLSSNYIAPISDAQFALSTSGEFNTLFVPYDNDAWIRYATKSLDTIKQNTSAEVGVIYSDFHRAGLIIGSLQHTTWKSAVQTVKSNSDVKIAAFAGYTEQAVTRDPIAHGFLHADTIKSPAFFVGFYGDWRIGMETYAKTNRKVEKPFIFDWTGPTPVGWNSWGDIQTNLSYDNATKVVDFFHDDIPQFRVGESAFIDLDSYWDNLVQVGVRGDFAKLKDFVDYCKSKNLQPGVYWAPFTDWGYRDGPARQAEGTNFTFGEMWTKIDSNYFDFDGARALDPTHPGTLKRINYVIDKLKSCGFEMIKIDFLGHGAVESTGFYDKEVTTGMQAYKRGMEHLIKSLDGQMLVYVAISPNLATGRYAHIRRIACDAFKTIEDTEYSLNGLTYGWWQTFIYDYIDADHVVFGSESEEANQARLISAVITGSLITGDDFSTQGPWSHRAKELLSNKELLKVVENGIAFKPVRTSTDTSTANAFIREIDDFLYIAVFNYSHSAVTFTWPLLQLQLDLEKTYVATDLLKQKGMKIEDDFIVNLSPEEGKLFKVKL